MAAAFTASTAALVVLMVVLVALLLPLAGATPLAARSLQVPLLIQHPLLRLARLAMAEEPRVTCKWHHLQKHGGMGVTKTSRAWLEIHM